MDPALAMLKYFAFDHLPEHLKIISAPFATMAQKIIDTVPPGPERTMGMRKLLESKDCCVRAAL